MRSLRMSLAVGAVLALLVLVPTSADAFGTETFTYTFRGLDLEVTFTQVADSNVAEVKVVMTHPSLGDTVLAEAGGWAVRIPDKGSVLIGGLTALDVLGPGGELQAAKLPRPARRPVAARSEAKLSRKLARRVGQVVTRLYGDFFGLDDL